MFRVILGLVAVAVILWINTGIFLLGGVSYYHQVFFDPYFTRKAVLDYSWFLLLVALCIYALSQAFKKGYFPRIAAVLISPWWIFATAFILLGDIGWVYFKSEAIFSDKLEFLLDAKRDKPQPVVEYQLPTLLVAEFIDKARIDSLYLQTLGTAVISEEKERHEKSASAEASVDVKVAGGKGIVETKTSSEKTLQPTELPLEKKLRNVLQFLLAQAASERTPSKDSPIVVLQSVQADVNAFRAALEKDLQSLKDKYGVPISLGPEKEVVQKLSEKIRTTRDYSFLDSGSWILLDGEMNYRRLDAALAELTFSSVNTRVTVHAKFLSTGNVSDRKEQKRNLRAFGIVVEKSTGVDGNLNLELDPLAVFL